MEGRKKGRKNGFRGGSAARKNDAPQKKPSGSGLKDVERWRKRKDKGRSGPEPTKTRT